MTEKDLFETYKKDVYKTCFFMLHHAADAEDVCQDVFMTVFRHDWRKVEHLKTWLLRVTVNHCLNHLKKNSRSKAKEQTFQLQHQQLAAKAAETIVEERESAMECALLMGRLPGKIRAVVYLRFLQEYSLNQIAAILSIPVGTVKSRLNKGIKLMRLMVVPGNAIPGEEDTRSHGQDGSKAYSFFKS